MLERLLVALLANGHVLLEGVPGPRQDADRQDARARARRHVRPRPVHARPRPRRPRRHAHLAARTPASSTPQLGPVFGNLLLADEINRAPGEGAERAARGHAGAPGHARRSHLHAARAVPHARHAEPDRVRGHLPAARGAGRPLPLQAHRRLPLDGGGGGDRRPRHRARARGAAGAARLRARCASASTCRRSSSTATSSSYAVRLADATRYPEKYGLDDVARQVEYGSSPARADRPRAGGPGARAAARPHARHDARRARPRARRPAPPHGALLRGARRRHLPRRDPRARHVGRSTPESVAVREGDAPA